MKLSVRIKMLEVEGVDPEQVAAVVERFREVWPEAAARMAAPPALAVAPAPEPAGGRLKALVREPRVEKAADDTEAEVVAYLEKEDAPRTVYKIAKALGYRTSAQRHHTMCADMAARGVIYTDDGGKTYERVIPDDTSAGV